MLHSFYNNLFCIHSWTVSQSGYHNPADMPLQNPKEQIAMWQQNTYMSDSGIHSGATTNAPSLSGKEEEMDAEWLEGQAQQGFNQAAFTSEQVYFMTCRYRLAYVVF